MRLRLLALSAALAAGCSPTSGTASLTRLTQVSTSAACPSGGVVIATGADTDGNGTLDDGEVKDSKEVCNGSAGTSGNDGANGASGDGGVNGLATLILTTPLPDGDANCPEGGVRIDVGLDDGSGGGTAGNGTLEAGEIEASRTICNGGERLYPGSVTPPASPAGAFTINANGGAGTNNGGPAGTLEILSRWGTRGGHVKVFKTGVVDATVTVGTLPAFVAGTQPLNVTANTTIASYADVPAGLASPDAVFVTDGRPELWADVGGAAVRVTSISVAAGVTLTFKSNYSDGSARVQVAKDVRNAGSMTTGFLVDGVTHSDLFVYASNIYTDPGSSIDLRGTAGVVAGSFGGTLELLASASLVNQGTVDTTGGDGPTAGRAGNVLLWAKPGAVTNTGAVTTRGGNATAGNGGEGGRIWLASGYRSTRNSGALLSTGGTGSTGGGQGGAIELEPESIGSVVNSGTLTARGGDCTGGGDCFGGGGGRISLRVLGGELRSSGNLDSSGGAGSGTMNGGDGSTVSLEVFDSANGAAGGIALPAGSLTVSGNLTTNGGAGQNGGEGGSVSIVLSILGLNIGQEVTLLGYTQLNANGGSATNNTAGAGGYVYIKNTNNPESGLTFDLDDIGPATGAALNYADVSLRGGDGPAGGRGGELYMTAASGINRKNPWEYVVSFATNVDVRGGTGSTAFGGNGGLVALYGQARAENQSAVNGNGGNVSSAPLHSGSGGSFELGSDLGPVVNTGAVQLNSGSSSGAANPAGRAYLAGTTVTNSGNLSCNGGNATGLGGAGGTIEMLSSPSATTNNSGTLSVTGGNGAPAGAKGTVTIDGNDVTP